MHPQHKRNTVEKEPAPAEPVVTAGEMRELDRLAMEKYGIPGLVLMENAGRATCTCMNDELGGLAGRTVVVFVGPGNNGGDGLVVARHALQAGASPLLVYGGAPENLRGDAAVNRDIALRLELEYLVFDPDKEEDLLELILSRHARCPVLCLVDALFGTGLSREIQGRYRDLVHLINRLGREFSWPVVAVDMPSGLESDTGRILGCAVRADLTVTYGLAKPAHYLHGGELTGSVRVVDISIPARAVARVHPDGERIRAAVFDLLPARTPASHKGSHGHLLVAGGSAGMTGAAILACRAGLRSGCGLVSAVVPSDLNAVFEHNLVEAMTIPLPCSRACLSQDDLEVILDAAAARQAVVLGPGLGTAETTAALVVALYREMDPPAVVDADALNILAAADIDPADHRGARLLTPHPGEMARLLAVSSRDVQEDRIGAARELARLCGPGSVVVLKGAGTVVARDDGRWALNTTGNPGLAVGGSGDVLSGLIGGLLARGMSPWDAARVGVHAHGLAADQLARKRPYGFLATELAARLPRALCQPKIKET